MNQQTISAIERSDAILGCMKKRAERSGGAHQVVRATACHRPP